MADNSNALRKFKKGDRVQVKPVEELRFPSARHYAGKVGHIATVYEALTPHYIVSFFGDTGNDQRVLLWKHELDACPEKQE